MESFVQGEKIEIKGDYFLIGKKEHQKNKTIITLETKDDQIIKARLELIGNKKYLYIKRLIADKLQGRGIEYNGEKYQIVEEYWERKKINSKWERLKIYKLKPIANKEKIEKEAQIIKHGKTKTFESYGPIDTKDILFDPSQDKDKINLPKKIKIKYKEKI